MVNEKHQQWKEASRLNYKWLIERRVKMKIFQKRKSSQEKEDLDCCRDCLWNGYLLAVTTNDVIKGQNHFRSIDFSCFASMTHSCSILLSFLLHIRCEYT